MINDLEIIDKMNLPIELSTKIMLLRQPHDFIAELKQLKKQYFKEYINFWGDDDEDIDEDDVEIDIDDFTLFEISLLAAAENSIINTNMLHDVDFDIYMYKIYLDYHDIYCKYGYETKIQNIPDHIIEEYLLKREDKLRYQCLFDDSIMDDECMYHAKSLLYFRNEFRIPEDQIKKYIERTRRRKQIERDNDYFDNY